MNARRTSRWLAVLAAACGLAAAGSAQGQVKISEIWGGGGNTAAGPNADYVELFNAGGAPVNLNGWSVQITQGSGGTWSVISLPNVNLPSKTYFLVRVMNPSATGTALPTPDVTASLSGAILTVGSGKVALRSSTTALTGNPVCPFPADIVDFVGYGSASNREPCGGMATNNAPANQATPDVFATRRLSFGCLDTDLNVADFEQAAPNPKNSSNTATSLDEISGSLTPNVVVGGSGASVSVQAWVRACADPILGATVTADLSQFGLPSLTLFDDGVNDDGIANNGRYGASFNVPTTQSEGPYTFNVSFTFGASSGSAPVELTILPFAPENDDCEDAFDLTNALPFFASVDNQTASPDIDVGTCNTDTVTRFGFWYKYTASQNGLIRLTETSTQDVVYGIFNVFDTFDPCNNLGTPLCLSADTSSFTVQSGQTYYILVGNQTATSTTPPPTVPVQLSIEFIPPPANDLCQNAIPIFFQFNEFIDASSATGDVDVSCNVGTAFETTAGVWYTFTTGTEPGAIILTETSTADIVSALFTGPDCNSIFEVSCQAPDTAVHVVEANTTYYLLVGMQGLLQPTVPYAFSVDFFPAPSNDECQNAIVIDLNSEFSDTVGAVSASPDIDVLCNSAAAFQTTAGVWYTFMTGAEGGRFRVVETSTADTVKALFEGTMCSLFEVACADAEDNTFNLEANTNYYMLLGMWGTTNPTVEYMFTATFTPAQGACCIGMSCQILTQSDCNAMSGNYQGDNVSCAGGPQYVDTTQVTIVDNSTVSSSINVSDSGTVSTIEVYIDIFHSWAGDTQIRLTAPNGSTSASLINRPGRADTCDTPSSPFGSSNDLNGEYWFSDTATVESHAAIVAGPTPVPDITITNEPWRANDCGGTTVNLNSVFNGTQIQGSWTLSITDLAGGDTGVLRGWKMAINGGSNPPCGGGPTPCPGDFNGDNVVDLADLLDFLGQWNPNLGQSVTPGSNGDVNGDGVVDLADLLDFLGQWNPNLGQTCP
ncbi:MAG: lamin tail domain-containing protein [Phycisphaeraceae bacterium]|nr:lamin tail domain-containing protein [Phycisphaeraceae bacterium]